MKKTFDVVGKRKYFYTFSLAVIIIIAIILSFVLGMGVAIEFKGGTIITYSYTGAMMPMRLPRQPPRRQARAVTQRSESRLRTA